MWVYILITGISLVSKLALRENNEKKRKTTKMGVLFHPKTIEAILVCISTFHEVYPPYQKCKNK